FDQKMLDGYNVLKYTGGQGPYVNRDSYGISVDTPEGCEVDQMIMMMRHGERYPVLFQYSTFPAALDKFHQYKKKHGKLSEPLELFNNWQDVLADEGLAGQETFSGPYAGILSAFTRGTEYRDRYGHLWDGTSLVPIFAAGDERVVVTARRFGQGFFGYNYSTNAAVNIIPEVGEQGANSFSPPCFAPVTPSVDTVTPLLHLFDNAVARLNGPNPGLNITTSDVYGLLNIAVFELNVRGARSLVRNLFTYDEWVVFSYIYATTYYYLVGPGTNSTLPKGYVLANATLTLLENGPTYHRNGTVSDSLYLTFAHDSNVLLLLSFLGLGMPDKPLPLDYVDFGNPFSVSQLTPQNAHIVFERLKCKRTRSSSAAKYVRILLNDAVLPLVNCQNGPGFSCPLSRYSEVIKNKTIDYAAVCQLPKEYPQYLDFFWNYNTTTELNYENGYI
ncbi:hypothetical protein LIPSTDRAFT_39586, partial [Lipomyces starkeyi NRRL Y-11557]